MENKKYFIDQDNSGHNYVIAASNRKEWEAWLGLDENDEASWNVPDFAEAIDGISEVEFENPSL
jgi:hypothetical protein